jgi:hypothetical protein
MKISILTFGLIIIVGSTLLTNCGGSTSKKTNSTEQHNKVDEHDEMNAAIFSCVMHPKVTGKEGDRCPKCGMALVLNKSAKHTHKD